jgi:SPP1 gp7 family putative phage head morphogenesis protein
MTTYRQQLIEEEEKLFRSLSKLYRNIKRDMSLELTSGRVSWSDIQFIYRRQTDEAIRSAVTTMYELSARKATEKDMRRPFFITQHDMDEIRRFTQKYVDWYWIGLEREIVKKTMTAYDPRTFMRLDPSKIKLKDTFIGRMTESLHGEVAANAVISKAKQVIGGSNPRNRFLTTYSASLYRSAQGPLGEPHFVWRTAEDESTCPDCSALNGHVFAIDDPAIITPVEGTHPRCRCELELVDASETQELNTVEDLFAANNLF